ncbi:MAG: PhzF family phenazine biosynthesis protein [Pseudomonadota bacterium]
MEIRLFQVDAFASHVFEGNPAAVCPLETWPDDAILQSIATETNLSDTAFYVPTEEGFDLRWFTPVAEVDLCGHATLATAHVLFEHLGYSGPAIRFDTRSGILTVENAEGMLRMDFPAEPPVPCPAPEALVSGLGQSPVEVLAASDYVAVFDTEEKIRALAPDLDRLRTLDRRGVVVTAPGDEVDFVSRFFAPKYGIPEDPVTGSAHCELAPYWQQQLGRDRLQARQVSRRGGDVQCELRNDRVILGGRAVTFMEGKIRL